MYNYKTDFLNQKVVNLGLEIWPAFCHSLHNPANFISQNSFQIIQIVTEYEKSYSQAIF